jgi:hypothetical protein
VANRFGCSAVHQPHHLATPWSVVFLALPRCFRNHPSFTEKNTPTRQHRRTLSLNQSSARVDLTRKRLYHNLGSNRIVRRTYYRRAGTARTLLSRRHKDLVVGSVQNFLSVSYHPLLSALGCQGMSVILFTFCEVASIITNTLTCLATTRHDTIISTALQHLNLLTSQTPTQIQTQTNHHQRRYPPKSTSTSTSTTTSPWRMHHRQQRPQVYIPPTDPCCYCNRWSSHLLP